MAEDDPYADAEPFAYKDPDIAKEEKRLKELREDEDRKRVEGEEWWRESLSTIIGRRELWELLREMHAFDDRFPITPVGFPDTNAAWFAAGQQSKGQSLWLKWLKLDPDNTTLMMRENDPRFAPVSPVPKGSRRVRGAP